MVERMTTEPKPYNMDDTVDIGRFFREMVGYLARCAGGKGFVLDGTDQKGRQFAYDAFLELERRMTVKDDAIIVEKLKAGWTLELRQIFADGLNAFHDELLLLQNVEGPDPEGDAKYGVGKGGTRFHRIKVSVQAVDRLLEQGVIESDHHGSILRWKLKDAGCREKVKKSAHLATGAVI